MPVSQFCWEEGKTWENGYYLLSAVAEAISSIMANLEMAKNIHWQVWILNILKSRFYLTKAKFGFIYILDTPSP